MTNAKEVAIQVVQIFSHKLHIEVPAYDSDLIESGVLDSLQLIELVFQLEQQFGVQILLGETDVDNFRSIDRITLMLTGGYGNVSRDLPHKPTDVSVSSASWTSFGDRE